MAAPDAERAYIGLGANLGDAAATLRAACAAIDRLPGVRVAARSGLYRSAPLGYTGQPDFINGVAALETSLSPLALLHALQEIERQFGRIRSFPNAPRTLDLDLLLFGDREIDEDGLRIPHPRMHERAFVLAPLAEIAPDTVIPGRGPVAVLLSGVADQRIAPILTPCTRPATG